MKKTETKRVAIYARVSDPRPEVDKSDKTKKIKRQQNPEAQLLELRGYCAFKKEWTEFTEFVDRDSGSKADRPGLEELLKGVKEGKFDIVLAWKMDRIFRSLKHTMDLLSEFDKCGVVFMTTTQTMDRNTPEGRLFMNMLASFAEFERELAIERTKMGLAYARSQGTVLGRKKTRDEFSIKRLRKAGKSYREIVETLGCSMGAVVRTLK